MGTVPNIPGFAVTPFEGVSGASINLACGAVTNRAAVLPTPLENANLKLRQVRIANTSLDTDIFIAWGDVTVVATTATGMAVPHGDVEIITIGAATHIAGITAGGIATLNITPGGGV